jgi:hypothetical protein
MREEILSEILKSSSRWLDEYRPVYRSLGHTCALIDCAAEHPGQTRCMRDAVQLAEYHRYAFEPVQLFGVIKHFPRIRLERGDTAPIHRFLRRPPPETVSPPWELLSWLMEYHDVVRIMIDYVENALDVVMQELDALQRRPAAIGRPPPDARLEIQGASTAPATRAGHRPGPPEPPSQPVPSAGPLEMSAHLGVIVDEERHVLRRAGRSEVADLSGSRLSWHLALALLARGDRYCSLDRLCGVWEAHGAEENPEKKTIEDAISRLRKRIRPLGLTVVHKAELGYALAELPSDNEIGPGGSD